MVCCRVIAASGSDTCQPDRTRESNAATLQEQISRRQFPVAHEYGTLLAEMSRQPLHKIHRAMAPASAANGDGQVAAIVAYEARQPLFYEFSNVPGHHLDIGVGFEKPDHIRIKPGLITQSRIVVWIGKAAHVEHEVSIQRDAMFESERLKQYDEPRSVKREQIPHPGPECVRIQLTGVDSMTEVADYFEKFAFTFDRFSQRALVVRERVAPARLGEAFDQCADFRIEEDNVYLKLIRLDLFQQVGQACQAGAAAHVDADGNSLVSGFP